MFSINMMATVTSMSPDGIDHISNGLGSMARERRLSARSNRMERLLGFTVNTQSTLSESPDVTDLKEEDMWGDDLQDLASFTVKEKIEPSLDVFRSYTIPKRWVGVDKDSGLSLAFGETRRRGLSSLSPLNQSTEGTPSRLTSASRLIPQIGAVSVDYSRLHMAPQSAPVNVPDWSKILGQEEKTKEQIKLAEDDEDEGEKLPPHEFLARQYSRTQMSTFSVLEGAGRTLKGRDLSRVRSAVWRQTGFDE